MVKGIASDKLWCPPLNLIQTDPTTIKEFSLDRHLSRDTFFIVINFITSNDSKYAKLDELENNRGGIGEELFIIQHLSKYQLALLCYHILFLNQNILEKEMIEHLTEQLESKFLPPWKQFHTPVDQGLREMLLTTLQIDFENEVEADMEAILDFELEFLEKNHGDEIRRGIESNVWTIGSLLGLIDVYYDNKSKLVQFQESITSILDQLEFNLVSKLRDSEDNWILKSSISLILFSLHIKLGDEGVNSSKEILDDLWSEWINNYGDEFQTLRFLLFGAKSILIKNLFSTSIPFLSKRNLVQSLVSKLEDEKEQFGNILYLMFNQERIHPWVLKFLLKGFAAYVKILFDYLKMLPDCEEAALIKEHLNSQNREFLSIVLDYLAGEYQIVHAEENADMFLTQIEVFARSEGFFADLFEYIELSISTLLFIDEEDQILHKTQIHFLDLWLKTIQKVEKKELIFLYELDMLMLTSQFPFNPIAELIKSEILTTKSVLTSQTFEERIIKVISQALEYLSEVEKREQKVDYRAYEILLSFATEWLHVFSTDNNAFIETSSILSAIIIISISHLTRGYYQNKEVEKAFLMYLNMYYFSEFINNYIYSLPEFNIEDTISMKAISKKFANMVEDWDFNNIIDVDVFDNFATSLELSLKSSVSQGDAIHSSMLQDDMLFAFLDIKEGLDEFFAEEINTMGKDDLEDIKKLKLVEPANPIALSRIARIGRSIEDTHQLPIPLFRNLEQYAAAMELVPVDFSANTIDSAEILTSIRKLMVID